MKHLKEDPHGFRQYDMTTEQLYCRVIKINESLEGKNYCTTAFLDIGQTFLKFWYSELLYKISRQFPDDVDNILK